MCNAGLARCKAQSDSGAFQERVLCPRHSIPILKQNVGMFRLKNGVQVHFQSFGIFNLTLWDDVMTKFMPLSKNDTIFVGRYFPLRPAQIWWLLACNGSTALCLDLP